MMTRYAGLLVAGLLLSVGLSTPAAQLDSDTNRLRVVVGLADGSRIVGGTSTAAVPVESAALGRLQVPLKLVREIRFAEDRQTATVTLNNGDQLKGGIGLVSLELRALVGTVIIPRGVMVYVAVGEDVEGLAGEVVVLRFNFGEDVALEFVRVPAGSFKMGAEPGERPVHEVTFARPFYVGRYLVTQDQWQKVMGHVDFGVSAKLPMHTVTWDDCQRFTAELNEQMPQRRFSLLSEAQYEYACRAGSTSQYCYGDDEDELGNYGWYKANSGWQLHPVGEKKPNAWGLYDMHGNIYVWLQDYWHKSYDGAPADGSAWMEGSDEFRALRAGAWCYDASYLRSARRTFIRPDVKGPLIGLRVMMEPR